MELDEAVEIIRFYLREMDKLYKRPVFDEVAIVHVGEKQPEVYYYEGPRGSVFASDFMDNTRSLRELMDSQPTESGGEMDFTDDGHGVNMDAYVCLGKDVYLFLNNIRKSMLDIKGDPLWKDVQPKFLDLTESFGLNPLNRDDIV
jgi:hypothetical protein